MSVDPSAVKRLVVRPPNWLGDAVLALPALAAIRRHFPKAELTIAAPSTVSSIFREDTDVAPDRILDLPASSTSAIATLQGGRFDVGILLPNSFRSAWQLWRARVPGRWGYATAGRGLLLTQKSPRGKRERRHHSEYYRALVTGLGIECDPNTPPIMRPSAASARRADAILSERAIGPSARIVAMAPGAAYGRAKQWAPDRMAELASKLVAEHDATCVLLGASHDRDAARAIESWLRAHAPERAARVVDLVGRTTLGALVGVAARSAVFVSNDSGGMHLAAALGRPVVAIFGPTDERATSPVGDHDVITADVFCRPCMLRECPIDHRCMKRISVETVLTDVAKRLSASPTV